GALVLRAARREATPERTRRLGLAMLAGVPLLLVVPLAAPAAAATAWAWPALQVRRRERQRLAAVATALPDVVDLFVLAVGAGLTVPLAVEAVARRAQGTL